MFFLTVLRVLRLISMNLVRLNIMQVAGFIEEKGSRFFDCKYNGIEDRVLGNKDDFSNGHSVFLVDDLDLKGQSPFGCTDLTIIWLKLLGQNLEVSLFSLSFISLLYFLTTTFVDTS